MLSWLASAAAGLLMDAGFPGLDLWPLTLLGIAALLVVLRGATPARAGLLGVVAGAAFYLSHVAWAAEYLGPVPWLALSTLEALIFATGAAGTALMYRLVHRWWPNAGGRLLIGPLGVAGVWVLRETLAGSWPYGGFAWARLAYSQSQSPLAPLVAWVGVSGFSFLVVASLTFVIELCVNRRGRSAAVIAVVTAAVIVVLIPPVPVRQSGEIRVGIVQGAGPAGYFDERTSGELLQSQIDATAPLRAADADIIVWPENSMDEDPLQSDATATRLSTLSTTLQAPLLIGAITEREDRYYNSSIVWTGKGPAGLYDKNHPVPFGEYVPDRAFWSFLAPDLIGLVQRDYQIGTLSPAVPIGDIVAGVSLCFDIVDDRLIDAMTDGDAQVIVAQTNNADFGRTDESAQQLAISRIRAIQTGRAVVTVSTVGQSQILLPDGTTRSALPAYTPGALVDTVPLMVEDTPATVLRVPISVLIVGATLAPVIAALILHLAANADRRVRRGGHHGGRGSSGAEGRPFSRAR